MEPRPALRQSIDLRPEDFERWPVWSSVHEVDEEHVWYGETDEATYRPWEGLLPYNRLDPNSTMAVALATFTLSDGSTLAGFLSPPVAPDEKDQSPSYTQPRVFLPNGIPVDMYYPTRPLAEEAMGTLLLHFGGLRSQVFPISYEISSKVVYPLLRGELRSIYYRSGREDFEL